MLAVVGAALSAQAQKVTLRYNPPAGKTYVYASTSTNSQTTPQGKMSMKQTMTVTTKIVKNVGGKVTTETTMSGAKVTATGPAAGMAANIEKTLNGTKTTAVMDNRGRPVDMKASGSAMMQSVMSGMSSGLGSMQGFPAEPVGVGSKWSSVMDFQKMMSGMMQGMSITGGKIPVNMVLKSFEVSNGRKLAVISVSLKGSFGIVPPKNSGAPSGNVTTTMNTTAVMKVDVVTGMPVEVVSTGSGSTAFGKMKMDQSTSSTMKLVK